MKEEDWKDRRPSFKGLMTFFKILHKHYCRIRTHRYITRKKLVNIYEMKENHEIYLFKYIEKKKKVLD